MTPAGEKPRPHFPTGLGQSETHAITLSDGRPNSHPMAGADYNAITAPEIAAMVLAPQDLPKSSARWFMPSGHIGPDARDHSVQRECGSFWWFCIDIATHDLALDEVIDTLTVVAPDASRLVYATRSSTAEDRRWRVLLPLKEPLTGADYTDTALAFFGLLETASGGRLVADRKLALAGQIVYLPNRGEHYEHDVFRGKALHLSSDHPAIRRREAERAIADAARKEARERSTKRTEVRSDMRDGATPVQQFNAAHVIANLLEKYGYLQLGQTDHWRSPHQTGSTYATRNDGDHWVSLSGSDAAAGLGTASLTGARFGDAFDLFVAFEHDGNFEAAVRAYGEECDRPDWSNGAAKVTGPHVISGMPAVGELAHAKLANPPFANHDVSSSSGDTGGVPALARLPTPFTWVDPSLIPPRPWLYGRHLLRQQVSVTVAPGGVGKSSNSIVEALAMVSGSRIVGEWVSGPLRTWIYNLEDPADELQRRVTAAMIHHGIGRTAVEGQLFIDSGRQRPLCTAMQTRNGTIINIPQLDEMTAVMRERQIDVLIVDPFVSSHQVSENDNVAIDLVAKQYWAVLAQRCNCAVELVHHTRKLGGEDGTSEAARGASALLGAARSGRVLNRMTPEDRDRAGIVASDTAVYFSLVRDKANLAPPGKREWRRVISVDLANGDSVGVVEKWDWPDDFAGVGVEDLFKVQQAIEASADPLRYSDQARPWVGKVVASVLRLDASGDRKRIKRMIETWLKSGALVKREVMDETRRLRPCIEVGDLAK